MAQEQESPQLSEDTLIRLNDMKKEIIEEMIKAGGISMMRRNRRMLFHKSINNYTNMVLSSNKILQRSRKSE